MGNRLKEPPQNIFNAKEYGDEAMRAGIHSTLDSSSGSLTINRDILLNIPLIADWHAITQRREHLINKNLIRENQKRGCYDYVPQQRVLKKNGNLTNWVNEPVDTTGSCRLMLMVH
jgi:hypothetical protein